METTTKPRLNRWSSEPLLIDGTPKTAHIISSDRELLRRFDRYRFLSTSFIVALVNRPRKRLQARLSLLAREPNSYLERPADQKYFANEFYRDQIFGRTDKGAGEVSGTLIEAFGNRRHFPHSVMINHVMASLELTAPGMVWRQDIPKATNRLAVFIFPDDPRKEFHYENDSHGPFGVRTEGGNVRFCQLEAELEGVADRETLEQSSFRRKFLAIRAIAHGKLYEKVWGLPQLLTLVVCKDQHDIDARKAVIMRETGGAGCSYILFQVFPSPKDDGASVKPMPKLYLGPWQRAGHPDFYLNQD